MVAEIDVEAERKEVKGVLPPQDEVKFIPLPIEIKEEIMCNTDDVLVVLLMVNSPAFNIETKSYDLKIFGRSMVDWVSLAVKNRAVKKVECSPNDELFFLLKPLIDKKYKYTAVLYSDAPLLKKETFDEIIDYVKIKRLSIAKLTRGYVFETQTLFNLEKLYNPQTYYFDEEDFLTAYNFKQFSMICDVMKNRILNYHMKNGVEIIDSASTFIDADVEIGKNVKIYQNNIIKGNTIIYNNSEILENNILDNAYIMDNAKIQNSVVENSIVGKNCEVGPYVHIDQKSVLADGVKISSFNKVSNKKVEHSI